MGQLVNLEGNYDCGMMAKHLLEKETKFPPITKSESDLRVLLV